MFPGLWRYALGCTEGLAFSDNLQVRMEWRRCFEQKFRPPMSHVWEQLAIKLSQGHHAIPLQQEDQGLRERACRAI